MSPHAANAAFRGRPPLGLPDLPYAIRRLRRSPGFALTAVATLALCIGANVAIFALVDAIVFRSLPFPEADRLMLVYNSYPRAGLAHADASIPDYFDWRKSIPAFASVSITHYANVVVGGTGSPELVPIERVTPEYFATVGLPLAMGQAFSEAALVPGADHVAVLTDRFWRSHFNADPAVIGRTFLNDGISTTVVGVLRRTPIFARTEFYRPAAHAIGERQAAHRHSSIWVMLARLAPGATVGAAQAQIDASNAAQAGNDPRAAFATAAGYHTVVTPVHDELVRSLRPTLLLLQGGVVLLLLIGGVNLANLVLIRASGRLRETAVRQVLGARRWQLARDALLENSLVAGAGGAGGIALGALGVNLLRTLGVDKLPFGELVSCDGRAVAMGVAGAAAVAFLLTLPSVFIDFQDRPAAGLRYESLTGTAPAGLQHWRSGFAVAQIALTIVLLAGSALLWASLKHVLAAPVGFNPEQVLTANIEMPAGTYGDVAARVAVVERLLPEISALPGVAHAAFDTQLPFNVHGFRNDALVSVEGGARRAGESSRTHFISYVTGDLWLALGIPLRRGRLLDSADNRRKEGVCVVDQAFADRYWPGANPLGRRLSRWGNAFNQDNAFTVVGVVGNVKQRDLTEDGAHGAVYFPFAASGGASGDTIALVVRSAVPASSLAAEIRKVIQQVAPGVPLDHLRAIQADLDDSLVSRRSPAILATVFAGVALLLSSIGIYGALSYLVTQRRREIGIRMALGADRQRIRDQFLALGLRLLFLGSLAGSVGGWWACRAMQSMLYGVGDLQLPVLGMACLILGLVAILACFVPAHRAATVDPIIVLRGD